MPQDIAAVDPVAAAQPLADRLDIVEKNRPFDPFRWSRSIGMAPVLHLEDVSAIPFVSVVPGVEEYQHRARVRAGNRGLFAAVTPPQPGYEAYCREHLAFGAPELVLAESTDSPLEVATACRRGRALERLVTVASEHGGLAIHPYMSIASTWALASDIATAAGVPTAVIGPPPATLWLANDKMLLSELVTSVLGDGWVVETHVTRTPGEMAERLRDLATRHEMVALKRTRCASAMGNAVFPAAAIRDADDVALSARVDDFLVGTEWEGDEEVLAVAWEDTLISPSTQMWLPPFELGLPALEGVYEQLLEGEQRVFLGSRPSMLPNAVNERLANASVRVARALQSLGYIGRCSFDFIVTGDVHGDFTVRFVECNGRWGGTSTPMRMMDRLFPDGRPPYRAQDFMHDDLVGVPFAEVLARLGDEAFDVRTGKGRFVLYNTGPLRDKGKLDVISIASTQHESERALAEDFPGILGL